MKIIPSVNCEDESCFVSRVHAALSFSEWMHIDVSDGKFTTHTSFGSPRDIESLSKRNSSALRALRHAKKEVHYMVENPAEYLRAWTATGIERAVVHLESASVLDEAAEICRAREIPLMLALNPETAVDRLEPLVERYHVSFVQLLAVRPGFSGQEFMPEILTKIKSIKQRHPDVMVEVDGGMNPETVRLAKEAGADIAVSASYIFESNDPSRAYEELLRASSF